MTTAGPNSGRSPSGSAPPRGRRARPVTQSPTSFHGAWGAVTNRNARGLQAGQPQGRALGDGVDHAEEEPYAEAEGGRRAGGQGGDGGQVLGDELDAGRIAHVRRSVAHPPHGARRRKRCLGKAGGGTRAE